MNQFQFKASHKTLLLSMMGLGIVCLALSFFLDDTPFHARFWTNYLHNTVFFTGIAFMSFFIIAAGILAYAGWYVAFKRIWEAFAQFMIVGLVMMAVVVAGTVFHWHHLYHWADASIFDEGSAGYDAILVGKSAFLNIGWYAVVTFLFLGSWVFIANKLRQLSLREDREGSGANFSLHRKMRMWAAAGLPVAGFTSGAVIWLWIMSLDAHWYSTLYAWYVTASWFVSAIALTILMIIYLKSQGLMEFVKADHLHDLGKFLFAFSIFWTYLWFSQFMLIWYGNVGEETVYFYERMQDYPIIFYGNLMINFLLPFFILMRNDTKRKYGTLIFCSVVVFFGHWLDFFQMIKPGALHTALEAAGAHGHEGGEHAGDAGHHVAQFVSGFTIPGLLELGIFVGFIGGFLYFAFAQIAKAPLLAENDPYIEETLHHHV